MKTVFSKTVRVIFLAGVFCGAAWADAGGAGGEKVALPDSGFEEGGRVWNLTSASGVAKVAREAAAEGGQGLRLTSRQDDGGAVVRSSRVEITPGNTYRLTWRARVLSGAGTNVYLRFLDRRGAEAGREVFGGSVNTDRGSAWSAYRINAVPPTGAAALEVVIERSSGRPAAYEVDVDDFELTAFPLPVASPWPGSYKLRPDEAARLTAADVVAPDGLVYPDWSLAGVQGGIPELATTLRLEELGAKAGQDISKLIEQAADRLKEKGGGVVQIGAGTFYLDEPVMIHENGVVVRGEGRERTRLVFRYRVPMGELRFFRLAPRQVLGNDSFIEFHANPKNLVALELRSDGRSLNRRVRQDHWGNTFSLRVSARQVLERLGDGMHKFVAMAEYEGGIRVEREIELQISDIDTGEPLPSQVGALSFVGAGPRGDRMALKADGKRGTRVVDLGEFHDLTSGERILLVAPASDRWRMLTGHASHWDIQAQNLYEIVAVNGNEVTLHQPLRTEFLVEDRAYVQRFEALRGGGVEQLTLEQETVPNQGKPGPMIPHTLWHAIEDLWTTGVSMHHVWGCWMRQVTVKNTGRNSAYFLVSKHVEVRDCLFDDAIFKGGGGTGYIGFDRTWDSLMDNVETRGMRHAPNNQWNSAGNVIRNSRFLGSDGQWHAGWTMENLYENNFIDARGRTGSYGHGLYASGPSSGIHGPQGPRNVVYGNDVVARRDGLHMLGGNEGWMILHNRFDMRGRGRAIFAKEKSFDHIIAGNVFVLRDAEDPIVLLGSDSVGVELVDNVFYGGTPPLVGFSGGRTQLAKSSGNRHEPGVPAAMPERPRPVITSIFQWQRDNASAIREAAESRSRNGAGQ